ncbi:MAG: SurA N-terminal domain-containing protein [Syntrophobacteraceae bacterium]|jgi:peptidyl-prolyl cis-trans isomerase D
MLDFVRKHAKSWVIKVFLWLIVIVFVGWGGYAYQTRHEYDIARVGDHYISSAEYDMAYNNLVEGIRKQFGRALPDELMRSLNLRQQALQSLIEHYLILRGANDLGLVATTDEVRRRILEIPAFQAEGKFDPKRYEGLLRQMRMTPDIFEQQMSEDITTQKVQAFIKGRAVVAEDEILTDYHLNRDQIKIAYAVFDPGSFEDKVTVEETALLTFYQNNQDRYMEPEKREISFVLLDRDALEKEVHPSDDEMKRYYDENAAKFAHEKQVRAQHILFRIKPDAADAEVEKVHAQAQKILDEAKKGKDFAELAKKHSQDEGTAKKGGELGFFSSKQMEPAFSAAAFALKPGEISDLVRTPHGFHIIKLEEIAEAGIAPFDEVKGQIEKEIKSQGAQDTAFKRARNLRDLAYARKDVDKAAQEMQMTVSSPVWIDKSEDQPDSGPFPRQIKAKLFQLAQGDISDMLELPKGFAVAQVKAIKRPQPIPFENVKDKVTRDFRADQAKELAQKRASEILAQAKEKNNLADVAKARNISLRQSEFFSRQDLDKDLKLLGGASLNSIFSLQDSKPFPESPLELGNGFIVCQFLGKNPAGQPSEEEKAEISGRIIRQKQTAVWDSWLSEIRKITKVERLKEV